MVGADVAWDDVSDVDVVDWVGYSSKLSQQLNPGTGTACDSHASHGKQTPAHPARGAMPQYWFALRMDAGSGGKKSGIRNVSLEADLLPPAAWSRC